MSIKDRFNKNVKQQTNLFAIFHVMDELKTEIIKKSTDVSKFLDPNIHQLITRYDHDCHVGKADTDINDKISSQNSQKNNQSDRNLLVRPDKNIFMYNDEIYCVPEDFFYKCIGNLECLRNREFRNIKVQDCYDNNTCLFWNDQIKNSRNSIIKPCESTNTGVYKKNSPGNKGNKQKPWHREFIYFHDNLSRSPLYWTLWFIRDYKYSVKQKPKCVCRNGSRTRDGITCINPWHYILLTQD